MHGAAYRALGLEHTYEKIETTTAELAERVAALRAGTLSGLNVTVPHKTEVLALVDSVDASAAALGAANTLVRTSEGVRAYNTDAPALQEELVRLARGSERFAGRSAIVIGTGGAARAAIFALGRLGVGRVVVRGRRTKEELASVLTATGSKASFACEGLAAPGAEASDLVAVVQTTTAGMTGSGVAGEVAADAIAWSSVPADCVVYDVVYTPPRTALLDRAAARGLANDSGLGMLVGQGALAFELWLGVKPPVD